MAIRNDAQAAAGAFLQQELRHKLARAYEKEYPEIVYSKILPVSFEVPEGAETYTYDLWDRVGEMDLISDSGDDLPTSDVKRGEVINQIRQYGTSFRYTTEEIRKAQFANISLDQRKADAARSAYEERANRVALFGQAGTGLKGFFNHPAVDRLVITGSATDGWFDAANITPDQMVAILNEPITYQGNVSNQVEAADTLLLPYTDHRKVATTKMGTNDSMTVLDFFLKCNPQIKRVMAINELDPSKSFGNLSAKRMVLYKYSEEKVKFMISMALKFLPPQPVNLAFKVPAEAKFAGVAAFFPKSITYVDKG
jgi:hypothetical protein